MLDAKLQLIRLRQLHPPPRLTIPAATAQLDAQVADMQKLDDTLQELNENIDRVKVKVKDGARDVERLRVERADVEKQAKVAQTEVEDGRVVGLYDWYDCLFLRLEDLLKETTPGSLLPLRFIKSYSLWSRSPLLRRMS